jgi:hypothetical protein
MMRERGLGRGKARASDTKSSQSELPALLLPQPRPPRIEDPDCGRAPVVEPEDRPPTPEEARDKRNPDNAVSHPGGKSA